MNHVPTTMTNALFQHRVDGVRVRLLDLSDVLGAEIRIRVVAHHVGAGTHADLWGIFHKYLRGFSYVGKIMCAKHMQIWEQRREGNRI